MRRLLFVHANADLYGADLVMLRIASEAVRIGWQVEAVLPFRGPLAVELESLGVPVATIDPLVVRRADLRWPTVLALPFRWVRDLVRLWWFGRHRRFDIVHTNTVPAFGGFLLARWTHARHVMHVQEIFWQRRFLRLLERPLARCDRLMCISTAVREQFESSAVRERCRLVYTGVDVPPGVPEREPLGGDAVELITVGRLNEWKGQDILVDAVAELREELPSLRLRLVGDVFRQEWHHRRRLEKQVARLGLRDIVTFEGVRRDALELVGQADIVVVPSKRPEPFGMVLVEGMALGRPVIATHGGGPGEILTDGDDGLLVPPGDPHALAAAIRRLVADPASARAMAERGRVRSRDFTAERMVRAALAVYDEVLPPPRATAQPS